jgi:hypothetical protein
MDQAEIEWMLLISSLATAHTHALVRSVEPVQCVPFTLQSKSDRAQTMAIARFVQTALTIDPPLGWHTQSDHLRR